MTTLFGHLAARIAKHPENLAIEALLYLVQQSDCQVSLKLRRPKRPSMPH